MKAQHWILLLMVLSASTWLVLKTSDTEPRVDEKIDLNWKFTMEDDSTFCLPEYNDNSWEIISLPHDWMIRQSRGKNNPSGTAGGFYEGGIGWYRKYLDLSSYKSYKQFYLSFDGVYMNADIWINGTHLGKHKYGYVGFHFDISNLIRKDTINTIAVRTDCSELPVDRWYSGAGIYRHVHLIASDKLHFPVQNTKITSSDKNGERIAISQIEIRNNEKRSQRFKIRSDLLDPDGKLIKSSISSAVVEGNSSIKLTEEHLIPDPVYWSDKNPALYSLHTFLIYKKKITDNIQNDFGIRDIMFSPDSGFILNNKKVWLKGVCIHHDGGALGSAVPEATWEYRLRNLKELGVNALRLAHNPHAPELLDLCDRMGFFVINEIYDKWELNWEGANSDFDFEDSYEDDLRYFIRRDINHPSVICWSMGNETIEQLQDPESGRKWYSRLANLTHQLDSGRMVTCGLHPGSSRDGIEIPSSYIQVEPLVSYNYRSDSFAVWHERYPDLIWLASESNAYNKNRRPIIGDVSYTDNSWNDMEPFIAGQFIWAGIDYFGESASWPYRSTYNGLLKTNAEIKPLAYYTQSIYSEEPMVKIVVVDEMLIDSLKEHTNLQAPWAGAPVVRHWNFKDNETLKLLIYTNCKEVHLFLNDSASGNFNKSDFQDGVISTDIKYKFGKISAIAYFTKDKDRNQLVRDSILSADNPSMIVMEPDKTEMMADGNDVVHIETRVADHNGRTYPTADHMINYKVKGPGNIKVIDNGDPADQSPYNSQRKRVRQGTQLVIIQSTLEPGDLTISASAEGLNQAVVNVKSLAAK